MTPTTGAEPSLGLTPSPGGSLPRQQSSIQRSLRKSATSSDTFKALLLKKGSRSENSFRMSAAELLRTTDPRFQRTRSLDTPPESPTHAHGAHDSPPGGSPAHGRRATETWTRSECLSPSRGPSSPSSPAGPKLGRSRTPPSAASSKYAARCRLLSSPMTVICERDGETGADEATPPTHNTNGAPHEDSG